VGRRGLRRATVIASEAKQSRMNENPDSLATGARHPNCFLSRTVAAGPVNPTNRVSSYIRDCFASLAMTVFPTPFFSLVV